MALNTIFMKTISRLLLLVIFVTLILLLCRCNTETEPQPQECAPISNLDYKAYKYCRYLELKQRLKSVSLIEIKQSTSDTSRYILKLSDCYECETAYFTKNSFCVDIGGKWCE